MARMRLDPDQDEALVERCLKGEAPAWQALVARHERLVYAVARSYRLSDEDLADVFQEVFAALVRGLSRIRDGRALTRWLATTTDRIALATALRRRREEAQRATTEPHVLDAQPSQEPLPEAGLEVMEQQALVRLALSSLPARCRKLLQALYYEDPPVSYRELAKRLGVPVGSLGPTRARCFEKMRSALAESPGSGPGISGRAKPTSTIERQRDRGAGRGRTGPTAFTARVERS